MRECGDQIYISYYYVYSVEVTLESGDLRQRDDVQSIASMQTENVGALQWKRVEKRKEFCMRKLSNQLYMVFGEVQGKIQNVCQISCLRSKVSGGFITCFLWHYFHFMKSA